MRIDCLNPNYNEAEKLFFSKPDMENLREVEHMVSHSFDFLLNHSYPTYVNVWHVQTSSF